MLQGLLPSMRTSQGKEAEGKLAAPLRVQSVRPPTTPCPWLGACLPSCPSAGFCLHPDKAPLAPAACEEAVTGCPPHRVGLVRTLFLIYPEPTFPLSISWCCYSWAFLGDVSGTNLFAFLSISFCFEIGCIFGTVRFTTKLSTKYQDSPYTSGPHTCRAYLPISIPPEWYICDNWGTCIDPTLLLRVCKLH